MEWNEDTIGRLRTLWSDGHSTAEIGRRLGVSKNAIVGKAHRLDLPARPSPIRRDGLLPTAPRPIPRRIAGPTLPPLASAEEAACLPVRRPEPVRGVPARAKPVRIGAARLDAPRLDATRLDASRVEAGRPEPASLRPIAPVAPAAQALAAAPRTYGRTVACCWPLGEPGTREFRFCDATSVPGKPYCAAHAQLAYVKVRDRRDDAA